MSGSGRADVKAPALGRRRRSVAAASPLGGWGDTTVNTGVLLCGVCSVRWLCCWVGGCKIGTLAALLLLLLLLLCRQVLLLLLQLYRLVRGVPFNRRLVYCRSADRKKSVKKWSMVLEDPRNRRRRRCSS